MKKILLLLISFVYLLTNAVAQIDTLNTVVSSTLSGTILDENKIPLAYANIISLNTGKGTISNENGNFSIDIFSLNDTDIIRFQCIGYKTKDYKIESLKNNSIILLRENIYLLDEVMILGTTPIAEKIVKNILIYKDSNYRQITQRKQVFVRERSTTDILKFKLDYIKNKEMEITPEMLQTVETHTPKHTQSYSDLLANIYLKKDDFKFNPIQVVELEEEEIKELSNFQNTFNKLFKATKDDEFWRIKTGIIGGRIPSSNNDSLKNDSSNTINSKISSNRYKNKIRNHLDFATFKDKEQWEFLYKTNRYNFEVIGGTSVNNESVYVIEFSPKKKGIYEGRLYVSIETSALIRADYKYAPNKLGKNIQLLGIGFAQTNFSGSIYFEKNQSNYNLKYLSFQNNQKFSINRKFSLQKKKKRLGINKKLKEIKIGVDFVAENNESIELLVIEQSRISDIEFDEFFVEEHIGVTNVNQFDKNLWKNHTTIEPTQKMREYRKIE